jgi:hypothetical protein
MYKKIKNCRLCGCKELEVIVDLGEQYLTGVFPRTSDEELTCGPLMLAFCKECFLVQLLHSYNLDELYGENYGYRSGLNRTMVEHLGKKVEELQQIIALEDCDIVLDIGSNDGTLLSFYDRNNITIVGFDPSAEKFKIFYKKGTSVVTDFFSASRFKEEFGEKAKAKIVTSISMFYDLEEPLDFVHQVSEILDDEGIWHFEQSYLPFMLEANAYDTICHEHLEYYGLKQIKWMTDRANLKIINVEFNKVNGGSFAVTVAKKGAKFPTAEALVEEILQKEMAMGLNTLEPYKDFQAKIVQHKEELLSALHKIKEEDELIVGYGASTKGNVILQYCGIDVLMIPAIAEVNDDKFGRVTPGTIIPIISEENAKKMKPTYFLVLPWHFRDNIIERESKFLKSGGKLLFPLPKIEIV